MLSNVMFHEQESSWIDHVTTNLKDRIAFVTLKNGDIYAYNEVSRRAILNLMFDNKQSLGKWVNNNCKKNAHLELDACFIGVKHHAIA